MSIFKNISDEEIKLLKAEYQNDGFFVIRNFINANVVSDLNNIIDNLKPLAKIPFSKNVPWGYGNLIKNKDILRSLPIDDFVNIVGNFIRSGNKLCNHILVVDKAPFIGPDVEWHQEFFNINTYAPGYSTEEDLDCFIQIFTALDEHNSKNGPLLVFKGSHNEGLLSCEDIINSNLSHKRRIIYKDLLNLSQKYELKEVILNPGDSIFFNHLLVHGSQTNCSALRRRAILHQFRTNKLVKDNHIYKKEVDHRKGFLIDNLKEKINLLSKRDPYKDMK